MNKHTLTSRLAVVIVALTIATPTAAISAPTAVRNHGYTTIDTSTHPTNPRCRVC